MRGHILAAVRGLVFPTKRNSNGRNKDHASKSRTVQLIRAHSWVE